MKAQDFLLCTNDAMTQVRNERSELLGCIPRLPENSTGLRGNDGQPYMLRLAAVSMLCIPNNVNPSHVIPGFIPLDLGEHADIALPPTAVPEEPTA